MAHYLWTIHKSTVQVAWKLAKIFQSIYHGEVRMPSLCGQSSMKETLLLDQGGHEKSHLSLPQGEAGQQLKATFVQNSCHLLKFAFQKNLALQSGAFTLSNIQRALCIVYCETGPCEDTVLPRLGSKFSSPSLSAEITGICHHVPQCNLSFT